MRKGLIVTTAARALLVAAATLWGFAQWQEAKARHEKFFAAPAHHPPSTGQEMRPQW